MNCPMAGNITAPVSICLCLASTSLDASSNMGSLAPIYRRIKAYLVQRGFVWRQGSYYHRPDSIGSDTWIHAVGLRTIRPPGVIPTVIKGLEMFTIQTQSEISSLQSRWD